MPCDYSLYPPDWKERRARIQERAKHQCERCCVPNYAVGYRDASGAFIPLCGNGPCDAAGAGRTWPSYERITYTEASQIADIQNDHLAGKRACDGDGNHWFVVVLTIAHLDDSGDLDCPDDRLQALCQRCHNRMDAPMRRTHAAATIARRKQEGQPVLALEASVV